MSNPFSVGDVVYKRTGSCPMEVHSIDGASCICHWSHCGNPYEEAFSYEDLASNDEYLAFVEKQKLQCGADN